MSEIENAWKAESPMFDFRLFNHTNTEYWNGFISHYLLFASLRLIYGKYSYSYIKMTAWEIFQNWNLNFKQLKFHSFAECIILLCIFSSSYFWQTCAFLLFISRCNKCEQILCSMFIDNFYDFLSTVKRK